MAQAKYFSNLDGHQYMSLTTFRKDGTPVPTPVWFVERDGRLYVTTQGTSGKAKRIRNNGKVTVSPCKVNGEVLGASVEAHARLIDSPQEAESARKLLKGKYKMTWTLFMGMQRLRRLGKPIESSVFLEIRPA
jgi:PPOX class probable F420-dependent enzyme